MMLCRGKARQTVQGVVRVSIPVQQVVSATTKQRAGKLTWVVYLVDPRQDADQRTRCTLAKLSHCKVHLCIVLAQAGD